MLRTVGVTGDCAGAGERGWVGRWLAGAGDLTLLGWVTVAGYAAAAWLCWRASSSPCPAAGQDRAEARREARLWRGFAVVLAALGLNKQLDLQSALTALLRGLARSQGWYGSRREYQAAFVGALAAAAVIGVASLAAYTRRLSAPVKIASAGLCVLVAFVLLRASSFHHVDMLFRYPVLSLRLSWVLELGGIVVTGLGAWRCLARRAGRAS